MEGEEAAASSGLVFLPPAEKHLWDSRWFKTKGLFLGWTGGGGGVLALSYP